MKMLKISALVGATMVVATPAMANTIMIDDFEFFQRVQDLPSGSFPNTSTVSDASIFGGSRTLSVVTSPQNATQPVAGSILESSGVGGLPISDSLGFSNSGGQTGVATVVYDAGADILGNLTGGTGVGDVGRIDRFFFEVLSADLDGTIFTTTVLDDNGASGTFTENVGATFDPFLPFFDPAFAGVDFTNVASLTFTFNSNGVDSFDGRLGSISAVPLPASVLFLLGGLAGLAGVSTVSKRRRKA